MSSQVLAVNELSDMGDVDRSSYRWKYVEPKTGRSNSQKSAKSQKLSKSKGEKSKKMSKSGNSPNFNITEAEPSFVTPKARAVFNRLQLAFIKSLIIHHLERECHIWIKTNALGYVIIGVLS